MAVAFLTCADDLAVGPIEGGEQCCGTVALVVVGLGCPLALLQGHAGLAAVYSLDPTFFFAA